MSRRGLRFLVNPASGGQEGRWLADLLSSRFPGRVHILAATDIDVLCRTCAADGAAIVACGGDGTVSHVLDGTWRGGSVVPVGIIPLGTGNDLARHCGWGGQAPTGATLDRHLERLADAPTHRIDRWILAGPGMTRTWFNYWSMGFDAAIALRFHRLRARRPWLFRHRVLNLGIYAVLGLPAMLGRLGGAVRCDQATVPTHAAAFLVANISRWAGGVRLPACIRDDDGLTDGLALPRGSGLALTVGGLRALDHLAAAAAWSVTTDRDLPMQCDGEAFIAPAGTWTANHGGQVALLMG